MEFTKYYETFDKLRADWNTSKNMKEEAKELGMTEPIGLHTIGNSLKILMLITDEICLSVSHHVGKTNSPDSIDLLNYGGMNGGPVELEIDQAMKELTPIAYTKTMDELAFDFFMKSKLIRDRMGKLSLWIYHVFTINKKNKYFTDREYKMLEEIIHNSQRMLFEGCETKNYKEKWR